MSVDSREVIGPFQKRIVVWSDDPARSNLVLSLSGEVKPYVILDPGGYLSFWGEPGAVPNEHIRVINNHPGPLEITAVDHDLGERIGWSLEELIHGRSYRLSVEERSGSRREYTGRLVLRTNLPMKRELPIIIRRHGTENAAAAPGVRDVSEGGGR